MSLKGQTRHVTREALSLSNMSLFAPMPDSAYDELMAPEKCKTRVKNTSIESYHALKAKGLAPIQAKIIRVIVPGVAVTRRWLSVRTGIEMSCIAGRVNELVERGELRIDPERVKCPITGKRVEGLRLAA